jgi:hypothetical protein
MARSPAKGSGSVTEATTLIFPTKSTWEDLAKTKRETTKRAQSQTGMFGQAVKDAVETKHIDRKALAMVLKLDSLDDETLHVTMFHLIDGCKKLGIMKRAMAQEEMFDENRTDADAFETAKAPKKAAAGKKNGKGAAGKSANGNGRKRHPGVTGAELEENMKSIGEAARTVAETAGETLKH